jgi:uncharacterized membrane protein
MAIVIDAGPSPPGAHSGEGGKASLRINRIEISDLIECITEGVRDFGRAPKYGMFFGGIYAIGGLAIVWLSFWLGYFYLAYPFVMGFALFAPFAAAGTYEVSRRLERGEPLSWSCVLGAVWRRAGMEFGWLALVSLFTFIIWLDVAVFLFLAFYGAHVPSLSELFTNVFTTTYGMMFLVAGNAVGAAIALVVFSFTAVSPPLLVDRDIDFVTALTTSVRAVATNPRTMLAWAVVIGMDLAVSFVTLFVALIVILPVLGHTTWHLYRRLIA